MPQSQAWSFVYVMLWSLIAAAELHCSISVPAGARGSVLLSKCETTPSTTRGRVSAASSPARQPRLRPTKTGPPESPWQKYASGQRARLKIRRGTSAPAS
jgi:hypothetical protein